MSNSEGADYTYSYRLDGNQIQKTDSENGTTEYVYDPLGQLKSETTMKDGESRSISYDYDSRGNRISRNNGGIISQYTYDSNNRLLEESSVNGGTESRVRYSYDDNGNLIFKGREEYTAVGSEAEEISAEVMDSTADGSIEDAMAVYYTYNGYGELTEVETDSGLSAVYT